MNILDIRAAMLKNGYHPLPLAADSNRCVLKKWQELATMDNDALWRDQPADANIGSFCGADIITIDFDSDEEKPDGVTVFDWLSKEHSEALLGPIVEKTKSGGRHVTYRGGLPAKTYARFTIDDTEVDVEVKAANNYTCCPPSKTKEGSYEYLSPRTHLNTATRYLPELPSIFVEAIKRYEAEEGAGAKAEAKTIKAPEDGKPFNPSADKLDARDLEVCAEHYLNSYLDGATKGHRHFRGVAYARLLFGLGLSSSEARRWIESYASHVGREMPRREIDDIIDYGDQHPDRDVRIPWRAVWEDRERRDPKKYAKPYIKDEQGNPIKTDPEKVKEAEQKKQAELDELLQRAQEREKQQRADRIEAEQRREAKAGAVTPEPWKEYTIKDAFAIKESIPWIVPEWIPAGGNTIIYGAPNVGKTMIAQYTAIHVALGEPIFPPRMKSGAAGVAPADDVEPLTVNKVPVIFLELDQSGRITSERFKFLATGAGLGPDSELPLWYYAPSSFDILNKNDAVMLTERIRAHSAGLVVLDNLVYLSGSMDENSANDMKQVMKAIQTIAKDTGAGFLTIHHERKDQPGSGGGNAHDKLRGSTAIVGGIEIAVNVTRPQEDGHLLELHMTKNRLGEKLTMFVEESFVKHQDSNVTLSGRFYGVSGEDAQEAKDSTIKLAIIEIIRKEGEITGKNTLIGLTHKRLKSSGIKGGEKAIIRCINELVSDEKIGVTPGFRGALVFKLTGRV